LNADDILKLTRVGQIQEIARVGYAPVEGDDPIEIMFASGALFHVDIGSEAATDILVGEGSLLESAYGHLRSEEPDTWKNIARDWSREALDLPWAIGQTLSAPRRLAMTNPYRVDVGYVFRCGDRELVLMGEADFIWATSLDDPELEQFGLEIGAAL
jgi:hypothetical protein